jgi:hypothetical protein
MTNIAVVEVRRDQEWRNVNCFSAFDGFTKLDYEVKKADGPLGLEYFASEYNSFIPVGTVRYVKTAMREQDIEPPEPINYPDQLGHWIDRDILVKPAIDIDNFPAFIKPVKHKTFTGQVFESKDELMNAVTNKNSDVFYCSEILNFKSEYRVYINKKSDKKTVGIKHYDGDPLKGVPENSVYNLINSAINYAKLPIAFSIDFGVTNYNELKLIEVNDAYSLGNYGISSKDYASILEARWKEISNE